MSIEYRIQFKNVLYYVSPDFFHTFEQFLCSKALGKNTAAPFAKWLRTAYPVYQEAEITILSFCLEGLIKPLTSTGLTLNKDEEIFYAVQNLRRFRGKRRIDAIREVAEQFGYDEESIASRYERTKPLIEDENSPRHRSIYEDGKGNFLIQLNVKDGVTKKS